MIRIRAVCDLDGWVTTLIRQEIGEPSLTGDPASDPIYLDPPVPEGEVILLEDPTAEIPFIHADPSGYLTTTWDDRVAWLRLRKVGRPAREAVGLARHRDLGGLPDTPMPPVRTLRASAAHLDRAAAVAIREGRAPAKCPQAPPCCRPPEAHAWLMLAGEVGG